MAEDSRLVTLAMGLGVREYERSARLECDVFVRRWDWDWAAHLDGDMVTMSFDSDSDSDS